MCDAPKPNDGTYEGNLLGRIAELEADNERLRVLYQHTQQCFDISQGRRQAAVARIAALERELAEYKKLDTAVKQTEWQQLQAELADTRAKLEAAERDRDAAQCTLEAVMVSVDKWFDEPDYGVNAESRASDAREIALKAIEAAEKERDAALAESARKDEAIETLREALEGEQSLVTSAQRLMKMYLEPGELRIQSAEQLVHALLMHFDGPSQRKIQGATRAALDDTKPIDDDQLDQLVSVPPGVEVRVAGRLTGTLDDPIMRCNSCIAVEQAKPLPDNTLIATFFDCIRTINEYAEYARCKPDEKYALPKFTRMQPPLYDLDELEQPGDEALAAKMLDDYAQPSEAEDEECTHCHGYGVIYDSAYGPHLSISEETCEHCGGTGDAPKPDERDALIADMAAALQLLVSWADTNPFISIGHFVEHQSNARELIKRAQPAQRDLLQPEDLRGLYVERANDAQPAQEGGEA